MCGLCGCQWRQCESLSRHSSISLWTGTKHWSTKTKLRAPWAAADISRKSTAYVVFVVATGSRIGEWWLWRMPMQHNSNSNWRMENYQSTEEQQRSAQQTANNSKEKRTKNKDQRPGDFDSRCSIQHAGCPVLLLCISTLTFSHSDARCQMHLHLHPAPCGWLVGCGVNSGRGRGHGHGQR